MGNSAERGRGKVRGEKRGCGAAPVDRQLLTALGFGCFPYMTIESILFYFIFFYSPALFCRAQSTPQRFSCSSSFSYWFTKYKLNFVFFSLFLLEKCSNKKKNKSFFFWLYVTEPNFSLKKKKKRKKYRKFLNWTHRRNISIVDNNQNMNNWAYKLVRQYLPTIWKKK